MNDPVYDIWLHWIVTLRCNLDCKYCFFNPAKKKGTIHGIKIDMVLKTLRETGKTYKIYFSGGGEPFLVPNIIDACLALSGEHYIAFNTNLISSHIKEFSEKISPERTIFIQAAFHYEQLKKKNLVELFLSNYQMLKDRGFNVNIVMVAYPELMSSLVEISDLFQSRNLSFSFIEFIGNYNGKKYPKSYTMEERKIMNLSDDSRIYFQKNKICNAGFNCAMVSPSGSVWPCSSLGPSLGNVYNKINFNKSNILCPFHFCLCPMNAYDDYLFEKSIKEARSEPIKYNQLFCNLRKIGTRFNMLPK